MNAKNVNEILDALGARFGATGAHLWAVLIRQVYVDALNILLATVALWVGFAVVFRRFRAERDALPLRKGAWIKEQQENAKRSQPYSTYYEEDEVMFNLCGIASIIVGVVAIICTFVALGSLVQLANPEYAALQTVFGAMHK